MNRIMKQIDDDQVDLNTLIDQKGNIIMDSANMNN